MDCYVGASTGALKSVSLNDNSFLNITPIKALNPKNDEITAMTWGNEDQSEILTVQLDRQLKLLDCDSTTHSTLFTVDGGEGAVKGLHLTSGDNLITCDESGTTKIWTREGKEQTSWIVGPGITTMQGSNEKNLVATGGMKNLVKTWDMETGKQTWSAKNVPLDMLQLEVPIMITDLRFVEGDNQILEATKLHEMRIYDPRAQRRPVKKIKFDESPITSLSHCYRPNHIIAANSIGEMGLFDLRSKIHPVCKYKGQAGSIRSIDGHPTAPYVATCGIDRFIRVHNIETRNLVHKIYCKTRLNKVLMRKDLSILKKIKKEEWDELDDIDNSDSDDESVDDEDSYTEESSDDDVWNDIAPEKTKKGQKRKDDNRNEPSPEPMKKRKTVPPRKRKDSDPLDEIVEEPAKKLKTLNTKANGSVKKAQKKVEIKEELPSDEEEDPVPIKKRRIAAPSKNQKKV